MSRLSLVLGLFVIGACGTGGGSAADAPGASDTPPSSTAPGATPTPPGATPPGTTPPTAIDACTVGEALCLDATHRHACLAGPTGAAWKDEACAGGSGCFAGACTPGKCSDECTAGASASGKTCTPWNITTSSAATIDPASKMHDRARDYLAWLEKAGLRAGSVGDAYFTDAPDYTQLAAINGIGDSALWTGTLLGAEALRLHTTGSADARARVRTLVDKVHVMMNVAGEPGMLVRYVKESATTFPFSIPDLDCTQERVHCNVDYAGKKYDFVGHISRDQYQGVILGLALAYDALTGADEDLRAKIREDVVVFVEELMKERMMPLVVSYAGIPLPVTSVPIRFIVVSPREMAGGAANIHINEGGDDKVASMAGFQEFTPNLQDVLKHIPGIGAIGGLIPIPRASSAIMLASFFQVALRVTDGVPAFAKRRGDILAFYTGHSGEGGNVTDWLAIATQWADGGGCGQGYYANNITMMPMYDLARLETDPARQITIKDQIFTQKMWPAFEHTKNVFFSFIYASTVSSASSQVAITAGEQLAGFPVAPHPQRPVDLRSSPKYVHDATCADQVTHSDAVDVSDRVSGDFIWQRPPWELLDGGNPGQTHPGVDYLMAYFMGRFHGFLSDDTAGTCLVLK